MPAFRSLALTTAVLAATVAAADETCYSGVKIFTARGTFEPQGLGVQGPTITKILATIPDSNVSQIIYPASVDNYNLSLDNGTQNALSQINAYGAACPDSKIVIMGYSQGAQVVADALDGGDAVTPLNTVSTSNTPISQTIGKNIIAVVLFGDPNYAQQGVNNALSPCPNGAAHPRNETEYANLGFYADRLDEYCTMDDDICCNGGTSFAAHLSYWTDLTAAQVAAYVAGKYDAATGATIPVSSSAVSSGVATSGVRPTGSGKPKPTGSMKPTGTGSGSAKPTGTIAPAKSGNGTVPGGPISGVSPKSTAPVVVSPTSKTSSVPTPSSTVTPFKGAAAAVSAAWSVVLGGAFVAAAALAL